MDKKINLVRGIAIKMQDNKIIPKRIYNIINTICCNYCNKRLFKLYSKGRY